MMDPSECTAEGEDGESLTLQRQQEKYWTSKFLNTLNTGKISKPEHRSDEVSPLLSVCKWKTGSWSDCSDWQQSLREKNSMLLP